MGKVFAITLAIVAIASAVPILMGLWTPPQDISTHGKAIDRQMHDTMEEAGFSFLASQLILAFLIWRYAGRTAGALKNIPGGATLMLAIAVTLVGAEILALGVMGQKAWASVYFTPASKNALTVQSQAGQFAFYFRYPGLDAKFGPIHPDKINEGELNFFGLDPANDVAARDDIVTAEFAVPVNREINLLMHAKDVGHSFYVRELRIQQDFVPGLDLSVHFTATVPGRYEIVCTQLCGLGHYNMKAYLRVLSQPDFDQWLKQKASEQ